MAESKPKYQICYFKMRARGEFIRFMFAQAGEPFTDHFVDMQKWKEVVKPRVPLGHLPVLHVGEDIRLAECIAIGAFLGHELKLSGGSPINAGKCLMWACGMIDLLNKMEPWIKATLLANDKEKAAKVWSDISDYFATHCRNFTRGLEKSESGWFVGDSVTWADLIVGEIHQRIEEKVDAKAFDNHPKLREHYKRVFELPNIKKYVASRPETPF